MKRRGWIGSLLLFTAVGAVAAGLAAWKRSAEAAAGQRAASQPEPMEAVTAAVAVAREHERSTVAIGTVLALRSITLRNEIAGTVREAALVPGSVVEEGTVLVALDVDVEQAELAAGEAEVRLAETLLERMQKASENRGASAVDVDRARAQRDVSLAQVARARAVIERKTLRAPFRAHVGMSDVHVGQYLEAGTELTTLQGVDDAVHVDFQVPQAVAAGLELGDVVEVLSGPQAPAAPAEIVAVDARVDPNTRSALVRARLAAAGPLPTPGASVRVRVPVGGPLTGVSVPVSALRRGPEGDHVYVLEADAQGALRAHSRRVDVLAVLGDAIVLGQGVEVGEQVAASGSFKLREGVLTVVVPDPTTAMAAEQQ
jgi:membrane fusion protein (multidrug efflux system)